MLTSPHFALGHPELFKSLKYCIILCLLRGEIVVLELEGSCPKKKNLFLKLAFSQSDVVALPAPCVIHLFKYLLAFI